MAIILKTNKTHTSKNGVIHSYVYGVIDDIKTNKKHKRIIISVDLYGSVDVSNSDTFQPINTERFVVGLNDYDAFIANADEWSAAYAFILSAKDDDGNLIYGDFKSDE